MLSHRIIIPNACHFVHFFILLAIVTPVHAEEHENIRAYTDRGIMMFSDTSRGFSTSEDMITWEKKAELEVTAEYEKKGFGDPGAIVQRPQDQSGTRDA